MTKRSVESLNRWIESVDEVQAQLKQKLLMRSESRDELVALERLIRGIQQQVSESHVKAMAELNEAGVARDEEQRLMVTLSEIMVAAGATTMSKWIAEQELAWDITEEEPS